MLQEIAPHSFHIEYKSQAAGEQDILFCYRHNEVLLKKTETGSLCLPTAGEICRAGSHIDSVQVLDAEKMTEGEKMQGGFCQYLFSIDAIRFYCVWRDEIEEFEDYHYCPVESLRRAEPMWKAFAAITGFQLWSWYGKNRFCGRCGHFLVHSKTERAMCCPDCKNVMYPVIAPSVIVAVTNGDRLLLTRYQKSHSTYRNYALIAGYIETGETAEETVRREVMEEVGLKVKNIRYYKSQPWSFSGALLLGFFCEVDGDDTIFREEEELEEAVWMERDCLPDRSGDISLTSEMMERFRLNSNLLGS